MNFQLHLFKNSDCDLCKLQQTVFYKDGSNADITIINCNKEPGKQLFEKLGITIYPTSILYYDNVEIHRFEGFVDSTKIDKIIKDYDTKCMV